MKDNRKKEIEKIIFKVIKENKIIFNKKITQDCHLIKDLKFDSFALAQLTVLIEDKYGIDIYKNKIIHRVKDIFDQVIK